MLMLIGLMFSVFVIGMAVTNREIFANPPPEMLNLPALRMSAAGNVTLVAGSGSDTAPAVQGGMLMVNRSVSGGTAGHLTAAYNSSTGAVTITSSSGTDTSTIQWVLCVPGGY